MQNRGKECGYMWVCTEATASVDVISPYRSLTLGRPKIDCLGRKGSFSTATPGCVNNHVLGISETRQTFLGIPSLSDEQVTSFPPNAGHCWPGSTLSWRRTWVEVAEQQILRAVHYLSYLARCVCSGRSTNLVRHRRCTRSSDARHPGSAYFHSCRLSGRGKSQLRRGNKQFVHALPP